MVSLGGFRLRVSIRRGLRAGIDRRRGAVRALGRLTSHRTPPVSGLLAARLPYQVGPGRCVSLCARESHACYFLLLAYTRRLYLSTALAPVFERSSTTAIGPSSSPTATEEDGSLRRQHGPSRAGVHRESARFLHHRRTTALLGPEILVAGRGDHGVIALAFLFVRTPPSATLRG
jgi:hypothetical protein